MIRQIEIFDSSTFELLDMCFAYKSIKVVRKFRGVGSIEIVLDSIKEGSKFNINNFVLFNGETYIIDSIHYLKSANGIVEAEISGRHINQLLAERVLLPNYSDDATKIANKYKVYQNAYCAYTGLKMVQECFRDLNAPYNTGEWLKRKAPLQYKVNGLTLRNDSDYTFEAPMLLSEALNRYLSNKKLGYNIVVDYESKQIIFNTYEPTTKDVFFSEIYGNVSDADYYQMNTDEKNIAISADEDNLVYVTTESEKEGFERKEFINTDNSSSWKSEMKARTNASFDALSTDTFKYKVDFDLGDIVYYQAPSFGIKTQQQITEITETYDSIETIEITIGDFIPTIYDKLKGV